MTPDGNEIVILRRDVDALLIPSAARINLPRGTEVMITQALGDSFTVGVYGNLARIEGKDADALGKAVTAAQDLHDDRPLEEKVWAALKTCYDPEIPVNVVDLGLIYACHITPVEGVGDLPIRHHIAIQMTLTAPGCNMGPVLAADIEQKLLALPVVEKVAVEIVFDPPWDRDKMSEAAKLALGLL